ncbi:methyltransferase domain-containing protein [Paraburkholderia sp. Ac-20340]|uniref:methyltransferase domain-containing protein n=1 Tax=Paraburkholderia sp. Ac-20340 TaxID=2703888 RepID=UPI001981A3D8|nr:methyltransferase domain-containing protein [Paraburkholderia sp. Ac-20340]
MNPTEMAAAPDLWADWLLHKRFSNDANVESALRSSIETDVDRMLDHAQLKAGMTLLDVGSGDGTVGLRAIARVGAALNVHMSDVSPTLLDHAKQRTHDAGVASQCRFSLCDAQALTVIEDACVDAVTTRAVIGYLPDKLAVFREFYRVLKPGGRISLAEPIRRDEAFEVCSLRKLVEAGRDAPENRFFSLLHRWKRTQFPDTEEALATMPMTSFSERDLVSCAMLSGFTDIHMEFHIDIGAAISRSWDSMLDSTPFPWAPTLRRVMDEQFSVEERQLFEQVLRSDIGAERMRTATRMAYISAAKP